MTDETKTLAVIPEKGLTSQEFKTKHQDLAKFVKTQLREAKDMANGGTGDYGIIPYTKKLSLLKPGAEKLLILHGYTAHMELIKEVEDFEHNFVLYKYRCTITHAASGTYIADAVRSCNNKEKKHLGKSVYDAANTIESIAQKRALVAATVQATMASEIFDADVSDNDTEAPNKSVTREEDPRRNRLMNALYGRAGERGITDKWLHVAAKKKWEVESLTGLSNEQIEELTEFIVTKYAEVGEKEKPRLIEQVETSRTNEEKTEAILEPTGPLEAEIIQPEQENYCRYCKQYKGESIVLPPEQYFCTDEEKETYWAESKKKDSKSRLDYFLKHKRFPAEGETGQTSSKSI